MWAGLTVSAVLVLAFLVSMRRQLVWHYGYSVEVVALHSGCIMVNWSTAWLVDKPADLSSRRIWLQDRQWPVLWWGYSKAFANRFGRFRTVVIPLWIPFVIVSALTVVAWHRSRRVPPGHCRSCGYDLTGNATGRCPECGAASAPTSRQARRRLGGKRSAP